jgi:uncharacterized protein (DUF2236 family)
MAWVHNALTDSFLAAYQAYGPRRLSAVEADRFVVEQGRIGALLGVDPLPASAAGLDEWISSHPDLDGSAAARQTLGFLRRPPLPWPVRAPYRLLFSAAVATLPPRIADVLGLTPTETGRRTGVQAVRALRWALGSSPSWHLALVRAGAPVPAGVFRQPLPPEAAAVAARHEALRRP